WVAHCLDRAKDDDAIVIRESPLPLDHISFREPCTLLGGSTGLGRGPCRARGAKRAAGGGRVLCLQGGRGYTAGDRGSARRVARPQTAPFLTVIFNNMKWQAVSQSTRGMHPDGYAARSNQEPLTFLEPSPDFEQVVRACGGHGEKVEDPEALPGAIE